VNDNLSKAGDRMNKTTYALIFLLVISMSSCCNALKKGRGVRIPPYIVEYYHYDDPEKPSRGEKKGKGWYEHTWDNGFRMNVRVTRVEEGGAYFYRLLCRITNPLEEKVTLFDPNIALMDVGSSEPIEQLKCWNWQRLSDPCNITVIDPGAEKTKEIRFGVSTDQKYAKSIQITIKGFSFHKGVVSIDFYGKKPKDSL